jgi:hypothetical protein
MRFLYAGVFCLTFMLFVCGCTQTPPAAPTPNPDGPDGARKSAKMPPAPNPLPPGAQQIKKDG